MSTPKMLANANKFTYLAKQYPEKKVADIIAMFHLSPVDVNCALWLALELKWLKVVESTEHDDKTGKDKPVQRFEVIDGPASWDFGPEVAELENSIEYAFEKLNADEKDMEENYLANWITGYPNQDILIAMKHMLEMQILHEYEIEDGENAYIFYTLYENRDKVWGQKQFKTNPLTGDDQKNDTSDSGVTSANVKTAPEPNDADVDQA
jgi:hypothetical protein